MHRSRSREKLRADFDPTSNAEGYSQPRNYIKTSRIDLNSHFAPTTETNSVAFDFNSSSSKKKTKAPLRAPVAEDMSFERQIRRSSPTVIARLMGLDTLPSAGSLKPQKESKSCSRKVLPQDFEEKLRRCSDAHREFKDVFEIMEAPRVENHKNREVHKRRSNLKQSEMGTAFIRQSFVNAKRLSSDEMLQRSKEFDNAMEVLESNKDLFLRLLQEPHSLFSKHLRDLSHSPPSPHASHESSLRSEVKDKRPFNLQISDSPSLKKPAANPNGPHFRQPMYSLPEAFSEDHAQPTEIVILKPSLAKARKIQRIVPSVKSWDNGHYGVINRRELPEEEMTEVYQDERIRMKSVALENSRLMKKRPTELPKHAKRQMRNALATERKVSVAKYSNYVRNGGQWPPTPSIANGDNCLTSYSTSDNEYAKSSSPSSSSRWRSNLHETMRMSSTLGEMLALSDNETLNSSVMKKACPLSISSKDGWKDGFASNLPRSKSLSSSSLLYANFHHSSSSRFLGEKSRFMPNNEHNMITGRFIDEGLVKPKISSLESFPDGKGKRFPVREIHVSHKSYAVPLPKEENLSDSGIAGVIGSFAVPSGDIAAPSLSMKGEAMKKFQKETKLERNGECSECGFSDMLLKQSSADFGTDELLLPSYCSRSVSVSPDSYKEADQPSPVSVLELSPKADESTSRRIKKISSDLREIPKQRQFSKFGSTDGYTDEIEPFASSDEDHGDPFPRIDGILQAFRDEEDRDYSYLLDMLIDSGTLKPGKIVPFGSAQPSGLPVSADIFDKLEKKYRSVESWPRSERKLLFDLINSTLADISAVFFANMRPRPCPSAKLGLSRRSPAGHGGLVEEIWQAVVSCRKEVSSRCPEENLIEPKWFNIGDDSELIGREVENHLFDQLVTELILSVDCSQ